MRAKKVDVMQSQVIQWYRDAGYFVFDTHDLGKGFPDLLVVKPVSTFTFMVEVKSSKDDTLTPAEKRFHAMCPAYIPIVYDFDTFKKTLDLG